MTLPPIDFTLTIDVYERVAREAIAAYKTAKMVVDEEKASEQFKFAEEFGRPEFPKTRETIRRAQGILAWLKRHRARREALVREANEIYEWSLRAGIFLRAQAEAGAIPEGNTRLAAVLQSVEVLGKKEETDE